MPMKFAPVCNPLPLPPNDGPRGRTLNDEGLRSTVERSPSTLWGKIDLACALTRPAEL